MERDLCDTAWFSIMGSRMMVITTMRPAMLKRRMSCAFLLDVSDEPFHEAAVGSDLHFSVKLDVTKDGKRENDEGDIGYNVKNGHGDEIADRSVTGVLTGRVRKPHPSKY